MTNQLFLTTLALTIPVLNHGASMHKEKETLLEATEATPAVLYKIISVEHWQQSQGKELVMLAPEDNNFIHFAKEDQFQKVATKYWSNKPYVLLMVDVIKLTGSLVFESNTPTGTKYYHMYNGSIPMNAVISSKLVHNK